MEQFRVKLKAWSVSDDYAHIIYSTDGISWNEINNCERELMDDRYYIKPICLRIDKCESVIKKFRSLDDVIEYEENEKNIMIKRNNEIDELNRKKQNNKKNIGSSLEYGCWRL